jgi:aspartyl/asparaginyl-tRNA synthetase
MPSVSTGTAVSVRGQWKDSPSGKQQAKELRATEVKVLGGNDATVGVDRVIARTASNY